MEGGRRSVLASPSDAPRGSVLLSGLSEREAGRRRDSLQPPPQSPTGSSSRASIRKSGRYSQASFTGRYSRSAAARGSVRGLRSAADSSGLPFERILCIDEEGRDRTPKPLVAARPHGAAGGMDHQHLGWGSSEVPGDAGSDRTSVVGGGTLPSVPSMQSFLASEPSREASYDGAALPEGRSAGRQSMAHGAAAGPVGAAGTAASAAQASSARGQAMRTNQQQLDPPCSSSKPQNIVSNGAELCGGPEMPSMPAHAGREQRGGGEQQLAGRPQHLRNKASQGAPAVPRASRGIQVSPWELRAAAGSSSHGHDGFDADKGWVLGSQPNAGAAAADGDCSEEVEEAMQAMQQLIGDGTALESQRSSPTPSTRGGLHSQSASRRGSMAGSGRMSMMHGEDSRPTTAMGSRRSSRSSMQASEWSARDSLVSSRASFAAFMADGRSSILSLANGGVGMMGAGGGSSGGGSGGRASVLSMQRRGSAAPQGQLGQAAAVPQPTPAELAAQAARRQKAEQERALARMPGLLRKLQAAEKAVLLNTQQAKLAQYHAVLCCQVEPAADRTAVADGEQPLQAAAGSDSELAEQKIGGSTSPAVATSASLAATPEAAELLSNNSTPSAGLAAGASATSATTTGLTGAASLSSSTAGASKQQELQLLWAWQSELTGELPVSCLAWNKAAPGLLAVGYGKLEYEVAGSTGLLAVWSLTNPHHPLWHANTPCGVSCLDWSSKAAGCLAVGFFDGSVATYDVRSSSSSGGGGGRGSAKPMMRAPPAGADGRASGGHSEPVWRLRYVPKASDPGEEMLVSTSSDGRVLEWKQAQGLEQVELLRLSRQQGTVTAARRLHSSGREQAGAQASSSAEGYLGRAAGGTCFDFNPADPRTYLVGTEEGGVHKCSTAFSEQYIQSYSGHLAPVYQVCWSPFSPTHFLTASADWSVRLWSEACPRSLWTFQLPTAKAEVADVAFCPAAATLFAAAAGNTLQLWDVERSVLAPRAVATRFGCRLTALAFSQAAPVVVAGADDGVVSVYSIAGTYDAEASRGQQQRRLEAALRHHTAQNVSD